MPRQQVEEVEVRQRRIAANGYKLPTQLPEGIIVTDICNKKWKLGKPIGLGGFGEIYLASDKLDRTVGRDSEYVAKVEAHTSGPLFVEMNFYLRAAKREMVDEWVARQDLQYLGMPFYLGSGSFWHNEEHFRFLVIPRYGRDLEKLFKERGRRFHLKTVLSVALQVIDILEYIHAQGYVHADIKGSNLVVGEAHGEDDRVFLVDFGLATRYQIDGVHKEFRPDLRKAHDGTLEYTSRDAHQGAHSRRGDLEVLGYNLLQWLCSYLPWEGQNHNLDPEYVHAQKEGFMKDPAVLMRACFPNFTPPLVLEKYLKYVTSLGFETKPDYELCRKMFRQGLKEAGYKDDGRLQLDSEPIASPPRSRKKTAKKRTTEEPENIAELQPKKVVRICPAQPCQPKNLNTRATRSSPTSPMLESREPFDWERVLSSNPEKKFYKQRNTDPSSPPSSTPQQTSPWNTRKSKSLPEQRKQKGLENPTPAMIQVMEARKQKSRQNSGPTPPQKRGRSESISLPPEEIPTPAMEEVMQQRQNRAISEDVEPPPKRGRRRQILPPCQMRLTRAKTLVKAAIASTRSKPTPEISSKAKPLVRPSTLELNARVKHTHSDSILPSTSTCVDEIDSTSPCNTSQDYHIPSVPVKIDRRRLRSIPGLGISEPHAEKRSTRKRPRVGGCSQQDDLPVASGKKRRRVVHNHIPRMSKRINKVFPQLEVVVKQERIDDLEEEQELESTKRSKKQFADVQVNVSRHIKKEQLEAQEDDVSSDSGIDVSSINCKKTTQRRKRTNRGLEVMPSRCSRRLRKISGSDCEDSSQDEGDKKSLRPRRGVQPEEPAVVVEERLRKRVRPRCETEIQPVKKEVTNFDTESEEECSSRQHVEETPASRPRGSRHAARNEIQYHLKVLLSMDECDSYCPSVKSDASDSLYEPSLIDSEDSNSVHSLKVRLYRGGKTPEWRVARARRELTMPKSVQRRVTRNCGKL